MSKIKLTPKEYKNFEQLANAARILFDIISTGKEIEIRASTEFLHKYGYL